MTDKNDTKPHKNARKPGGMAKKIRDQKILAAALEGKQNSEIADELGVTVGTVSRALNSEEMKARIKNIDLELAQYIPIAIKTVGEKVATEYIAARDLLKNFGSMKQQLDVSHTYPQPTIIQRMDGSQTILGAKNEDEENE